MPIRINLLAEAQAAEELRRKDPAKRSIYVSVCIVVMVLIWASSRQVKIMADNSQLTSLQGRRNSRTNEYNEVIQNQQKLTTAQAKLTSLNHLSAERLLQGTLLDSLMHATVEGIQVTHMKLDQEFIAVAEVRPTIEHGKATGGRPGSATERAKLILNARDNSANPGSEQINKFKEMLAQTPYFAAKKITLNNILLKNLSAPQLDNESGKAYVLFSLECLYPEKAR